MAQQEQRGRLLSKIPGQPFPQETFSMMAADSGLLRAARHGDAD